MSAASLLRPEPDFHVSYAPEVPCAIMVWRGYHTSASFREKNEQVLAFLGAYRTAKLLCDIRHFLLIDSADQVWLNDYWLPRALAAGLRQCAIVTPLYYFNRVAVQSVVGRIDARVLQVEYFESAVRARRWLAGTKVAGERRRRRGAPPKIRRAST
jgi:hypothetical protein